jgi:dienelactone hydrolase
VSETAVAAAYTEHLFETRRPPFDINKPPAYAFDRPGHPARSGDAVHREPEPVVRPDRARARPTRTRSCDATTGTDSTGFVGGFSLRNPFTEDVLAGVSRLREMGVRRVILAGSCFGGRCALDAAAELEDVEAVVLLATSLRDYERGERKSENAAESWSLVRYLVEALRPRRLRGLFNRRARQGYMKYARAKFRAMGSRGGSAQNGAVSPGYERPFRSLVERGVQILEVFGEDDSSYEEYRAAAAGPLSDALAAAGDRVEVRTVAGKLHGFLSPPLQDAVVETMVTWAAERRSVEEARPRAVVEEPAS